VITIYEVKVRNYKGEWITFGEYPTEELAFGLLGRLVNDKIKEARKTAKLGQLSFGRTKRILGSVVVEN